MIKQLKTRTQLMSAAVMTGIVFGFSNDVLAQEGIDLYTDAVAGQATGFTGIINMVCYIGGACMAGLGIIGVKQHVENPSQVELKKPLSKMGVGGALLAFPMVSNVFQDGLGGTGQQAVSAPFGDAQL